MSYQFYKIMHFIGLILMAYGMISMLSVYWNKSQITPRLRKIWMICHGVGLVLLLVGGFGLAARLQMVTQLPLWVYCKLFIWLCLGALVAPIKRRPEKSPLWTVVFFVLVILAIYFAVQKPT